MSPQSTAAILRAHLKNQNLAIYSDGIRLSGKAEEVALIEIALVAEDVKNAPSLVPTKAPTSGPRTKTREIPASLLENLKILSE